MTEKQMNIAFFGPHSSEHVRAAEATLSEAASKKGCLAVLASDETQFDSAKQESVRVRIYDLVPQGVGA